MSAFVHLPVLSREAPEALVCLLYTSIRRTAAAVDLFQCIQDRADCEEFREHFDRAVLINKNVERYAGAAILGQFLGDRCV